MKGGQAVPTVSNGLGRKQCLTIGHLWAEKCDSREKQTARRPADPTAKLAAGITWRMARRPEDPMAKQRERTREAGCATV